jgi:hypothetical protein
MSSDNDSPKPGPIKIPVKEPVSKFVKLYAPTTLRERGIIWSSGLMLVTATVILLLLSIIWSFEPDHFDVQELARQEAEAAGGKVVTGYTTTATTIALAETLLDKTGGYLTNDIGPPGIWLDNIPNWEFGVLTQVRDIARAMRNDFSRSQSQSMEEKDLAMAEPQFNFNNNSWIFPDTEGEYRKGVEHMRSYLHRLNDTDEQDAQFFARADNLVSWLAVVDKRLGGLSQRLAASVGQSRLNTDLAGDAAAERATEVDTVARVKTKWNKLDDVFYEARGHTWALIHLMRAIEVDFASVLEKKNALVSLRQIIRELEPTQQTVWSPVILNGSGLGLVANHSLVMASYISKANAAIIDLKTLLTQG